ncbi:MAG: DNA adenine methylase [Pyrinomonadaceae bacterium]
MQGGPSTARSGKPIFRWAGSKRKLIPRIIGYWSPDRTRYVEPFMGSAALFFATNPQKALLADINSDLIIAYNTICEFPYDVHHAAARIPVSRDAYLAQRSAIVPGLSRIDQAARFLYLNRYCFNGLYRTNKNGRFNVPFSPNGTGALPKWDDFSKAVENLQRAEIICSDFTRTIEEFVEKGDFVYLDPPYAVANRRIFKQYGPQSFGVDDLQKLSDSLYCIDAIGASFVLSYAYCSEAMKFFGEWNTTKLFTHRNISGFAKHRRRAAELLVSNLPSSTVELVST